MLQFEIKLYIITHDLVFILRIKIIYYYLLPTYIRHTSIYLYY